MRLSHQAELCIGCKACQQACKDIHNFPPQKGVMSIKVEEDVKEGKIDVHYRMKVCHQCEEAECMKVCPVHAIERDLNGVVTIGLNNACIGCGRCVKACDYDALTMTEHRAYKCDLCLDHRMKNGLTTCQIACPMSCIKLTDNKF